MNEVINSNWTDGEGNHEGGVATGIGFTIAWQRGSLDEAGRNGAFLIEVLEACHNQLCYFQFDDLDRTSEKTRKFACPENQVAINHLKEAINVLKSRRNRREQEGFQSLKGV